MIYADDSQIYIAFKKTDLASKKLKLEQLISDIRAWMAANLVKCNDGKTEFTVFCSRFKPPVEVSALQIGNEQINPCQSVKNLGVKMDMSLSLAPHINQMTSTAFLQIRNLARIRRFLTQEAANTAAHAFISSRLDYCNSLLYGLPLNLIQNLQYVQNSAARLVARRKKYDHITPVLYDLHWLPVLHRIQFKILLLTYKILHGLAPRYLIDLLDLSSRSRSSSILVVPKTNKVNYGDRSFAKAAPVLWNNLPLYIKQSPNVSIFKSRLKTFMFKKAFFDREVRFDWTIPGGHDY